jgi:hypothetical protein
LPRRLLKKFNVEEREDFSGLDTNAPTSFANKFPEVPIPESRLSPTLLAAQWVSHDVYGEEMPAIAADLLEAGYDTPSLRRLAGEMNVACSADVEDLVGRVFRELSAPYPLSESEAKLTVTRQIAREVIAGMRNVRAAANHLEIVVWCWVSRNSDVATLFQLSDELEWDSEYRRPLAEVTADLIQAFARPGARVEGEKLKIRFDLLEGQGWIADDFDAPLPDEMLAEFEGRNDSKFP